MIEHSRLEEAFGFRRYAGSRYYGMVMALRKIVKLTIAASYSSR